MRLAVAQPSCVALDVVANVAAHAALVTEAQARVVVFPELSLTGYELGAAPVSPDDARLAPLVAACGRSGSVALVGAPVTEGGARYIGMLAVDGCGASVVYRKVYCDESEASFTDGPGPVALEVDGRRLGLAICRDTRFGEHRSRTAALGIDAYVAGILMHVDESQMQARRGVQIARELQVPVAFAGYAAPTGEGYTDPAGRSAIWAGDGTVLAQAGTSVGEAVVAELF
ncbi:carbon-nitrogen hydrolase family protein [Spongisporangium articulatum]|uniref:Carbon-nitrogen hydrolase family protein n=1 Tax=Spongisporangium articulatum TaxID=3362603 RepID=A0ABW8AQ08_9ACTN